jgi:hypothetical protein
MKLLRCRTINCLINIYTQQETHHSNTIRDYISSYLGSCWIGGWVRTRADLDTVEKINISCPLLESNSRHLARLCSHFAIIKGNKYSYLCA